MKSDRRTAGARAQIRGEGGGRRGHHPDGHGRRQSRHDRGVDGRGARRAQRGDIRAAVLLLLAEQPMHGYQLMRAITERTGGAWRPSPGAIYPTISQLEDEGIVSVVAESGRKLVTLTDAGRAHVQEWGSSAPDPFTAVSAQSSSTQDFRSELEQLRIAARTVGQAGSSDQLAQAESIVAAARRELYLLLAKGDVLPSEAATDASVDRGDA